MGSSGDRRAEAGIGTSIIFIALILTSSAAGSVIMSNMDGAGQQARAAFVGSLDMTSNFLEVRSAVGVCSPALGHIVGMELIVALGPGSGELDLSALVIEVVLSDAHSVLVRDERGFSSERVLSGGAANGSDIIGRGDLFMICFLLPQPAVANQAVRIALLPANGFGTSVAFTVPDAISSKFVTIR